MSDLTPELGVMDLARSLGFYRDILGFSVAYGRPNEGFAYLRYEGLELMLDQIGVGRTWETGPLVETKTYWVGDHEETQRQFCVQDPDGYLLRFCEDA